MRRLHNNEFKEVFVTGEEEFQLDPENIGERDLGSLLKYIDIGKVNSCLDYQYSNSKFPKVFFSFCNHRLTNSNYLNNWDLISICQEWLIKNIPLAKSDFSFIYSNCTDLKKPNNNEDFKDKVLAHIEGIEKENIPLFLTYAHELMNESLELHRTHCKIINCKREEIYAARIGVLNRELAPKELETKESSNKPVTHIKKIEWLGNQKQLGELFAMLKKKGWIDHHKSKTIQTCFTNADTIDQILKPNKDESGKSNYFGIYTPQYKPKFFGMMDNPKTKV